MTTRYRVEYALKTHRRDQLIEWIKGLLAVPFVLHSQPTAAYDEHGGVLAKMATTAHRRYAEIMHDVEELINDHIGNQNRGTHGRSKLKLLVPSVGIFFTPLLLEEAFVYQDNRRKISSRRFVPPSFNDIRLTLNSAQVIGLVRNGPLQLVTFDGDVTLYDDGQCLTPDNPVIPRILKLLSHGIKIGIVTAAGYADASKYYGRLYGLLEAMKMAIAKHELTNPKLIIIGGESNYLFTFDESSEHLLNYVDRDKWMLDEMKQWTVEDVEALLDVAEGGLRECVSNMHLSAEVLRKERAVGIIQMTGPGTHKFTREQLEETVLVTQQIVEMSPVAKKLPFCAFNGGSDVFVDIGDKSWGVLSCQRYLGGIQGSSTLHIGDQFLSAGANDFKGIAQARLACTTAWIANPSETVQLLDELSSHRDSDSKSKETWREQLQQTSSPSSDFTPPQYLMNRSIGTVTQLWQEWTKGLAGGPAVQDLNEKYDSSWRRGWPHKEVEFYGKRLLVVNYIIQRAGADSREVVVAQVEKERERDRQTLNSLAVAIRKGKRKSL